MADERTYTVTLVKVRRPADLRDRRLAVHREWLPEVGDTIAIRKVSATDGGDAEEAWGFVTA